ncbi:MAG TPA: ankyrin repeat domain-containing protein [Vicinamibacterales bacterium]|nr:ankyrin repeat domain-containing protein [Vicinamibacterales bacterium]
MRTSAVACVVLVVALAATAGAQIPLIDAVKRGDRAAVRTLLQQQADANASEPDGTTVLHWAAQEDDPDAVRLLLSAGAKAESANRYGVTPLQLAAVNGNAAIAKMLLEAGADPDAVLPEGETVLMTAARTGRVDLLQVLLDAGAEPSARERWYGEDALIWAVAENHADAAQLLIDRGSDPDARSAKLDFPRRRNGQSVLSLGSWTPLMYAARENALDSARTLVKARVDLDAVDPDGATALVVAIINANYEFAAFLLDAGADPNVVDNEAGMGPLYAAVDMHRLAVGHGRPNPRLTGTMDAVDVVKLLLAHKADPNARLKAPLLQRHHTGGDASLGAGATPIMRAAKSGDVEMMKVLLASGADPRMTMPNQSTVLMYAAGLGWRDGSPAAPSYDQGSPEEAAAAIELLLGLGLDINAANANGETALHAAVTGRGDETIVGALITHGASLQAVNKRGQTPLAAALASRKDVSRLVTLLQEAERF